MTKVEELKDIVSAIYKEFNKYSIKYPLKDVCTSCCLSKEYHLELTSKELGLISFEAIYNYNSAAKAYEFHLNEAKYFLPKQIELMAEFNIPKINYELHFDRFREIKFDNNYWNDKEINLLTDFANIFFELFINQSTSENKGIRIEELLIIFDNLGIDISNFLNIWEENTSQESIFHFCNLIGNSFGSSKQIKKGKFNPFAKDELKLLLINWITNKKQFFINKIDTMVGEEYNEIFNDCYKTIQILEECD